MGTTGNKRKRKNSLASNPNYEMIRSNVNSYDKTNETDYQVKQNDKDDDVSSLEDYAVGSDTEIEIQRHKRTSIGDAISAIMSQGGPLDANGSLLRTNTKKKMRKKKNNEKKAVEDHNKVGQDKLSDGINLGSTKNDKNVKPKSTTNNGIEKECNGKKSSITLSVPNNVGSKLQSAQKNDLKQKEHLSNEIVKCSKSKKVKKNESNVKEEAIHSDQSPRTNKKNKSSQSPCGTLENDETCAKEASSSSVGENDVDTNSIHSDYSKKSFKKLLKASWSGSADTMVEVPCGAQVLQEPFTCVRLPHFVDSRDNLLGRLQEELNQLHMSEKNNDIYKFHQSVELPNSGACLELRELLQGPVRKWLCKSTGIPLNDNVALSSSLYLHSDVLLCHDDELEGRRVAFILYLTGGEDGEGSYWGPQDGGSLDLFSCDESGRPDRVVQRLYPAHNTFSFFEVSPVSFHQVSEVLSPHKVRLSVNGWFHGPNFDRPPRPLPVPRHFHRPGHVELEEIYSWISPLFRTESLQSSIRKQFEKDSQIYLEDFVPEEKYVELCQAVKEISQDTWRWTGPPNRAHYQVAPSQAALPDIMQQLLRVLQSEAGLVVMAQLTGLPLHPLAPSDDNNSEAGGDGGEESDEDEENDSSSDDEEMMEKGDEEVKTLKQILKKHKKATKHLSKDSGVVQQEPPKKKRKKNKGLDASGMDQVWISDVGLSSDQKDVQPGDCQQSSMGRVYSSVRRIGHGCYSLILDDDNDQDRFDQQNNRSMNTDQPASVDEGNNKTKTKKEKSKTKNSKKTVESVKEVSSEGGSSGDDGDKFVLDLVYFMDVPADWDESWGGYTAYVAKGEQEELLTVTPRPNTLALVYRDADTFGFLKHVNCRAAATKGAEEKDRHYHALVCQYK